MPSHLTPSESAAIAWLCSQSYEWQSETIAGQTRLEIRLPQESHTFKSRNGFADAVDMAYEKLCLRR